MKKRHLYQNLIFLFFSLFFCRIYGFFAVGDSMCYTSTERTYQHRHCERFLMWVTERLTRGFYLTFRTSVHNHSR